ncbi:MAG: nitroreductase family protein [Undibacterium sp.]|uniref:nitroreductase family protein n=1 Tax=Undibacterium sp. TaxID=1914977 RepID=UPI00271A2DB3|nr:nitroreductase family protein [Undibacterium sp.]MDO8654438.1 nitroreductase family protein [Undibacterium sp.]
MNTLTKMAMGLIGKLKAGPVIGYSASTIHLPSANTTGGLPLMEAMMQRQSQREFETTPLPEQMLSNLLWAAAGINRPEENGRTTPSAMNAQEIEVYVALPSGLYRYAAPTQTLDLVSATDVRLVTGYQDFAGEAPLDLIYVANHGNMKLIPASQRESFASVAAGAMTQNVYLYCASAGLATVIRAWFDRTALTQAMGLDTDQQVLLSQTVGRPKITSTH